MIALHVSDVQHLDFLPRLWDNMQHAQFDTGAGKDLSLTMSISMSCLMDCQLDIRSSQLASSVTHH